MVTRRASPLLFLFLVVSYCGAAGPARAASFELLAYNTWMRPSVLFPGEAQGPRAQLLARELEGYDALVLAELFDARARHTILSGLAARGYRYLTRPLGRDGVLVKDGGVVIASRWPIVAQDQRLFGVCVNTHLCLGSRCLVGDCNAQKGVVYACVEKEGQRYHLFGSHAQAGHFPAAREVRARQMQIIRAFVEEQRIPRGEPVLIAGDLNVDRAAAGEEYRHALRVLGARPPPDRGAPGYSFDPATNSWARDDSPRDPRQQIDHILVSRDHLRPTRAFFEVRPVRAGGQDLSDHHAVHAYLEFPATPPLARSMAGRDRAEVRGRGRPPPQPERRTPNL